MDGHIWRLQCHPYLLYIVLEVLWSQLTCHIPQHHINLSCSLCLSAIYTGPSLWPWAAAVVTKIKGCPKRVALRFKAKVPSKRQGCRGHVLLGDFKVSPHKFTAKCSKGPQIYREVQKFRVKGLVLHGGQLVEGTPGRIGHWTPCPPDTYST